MTSQTETQSETQAVVERTAAERIHKLAAYYDDLCGNGYADGYSIAFALGEARALSALISRQQEEIERITLALGQIRQIGGEVGLPHAYRREGDMTAFEQAWHIADEALTGLKVESTMRSLSKLELDGLAEIISTGNAALQAKP